MTKNIQTKKSSSLVFFILFLCIIALRCSFTENISIESFSLQGVFFDILFSISISCILLIASAIWLTIMCWKEKTYKYTGFEIGGFIFFIAVIISSIFASNKRASLNDGLTLLAVIASAITLVQLLDSELKRKILLFFIIAIAVVNVYQCCDQYFSGNKMMIEEYNANPKQQLRQLGIEPGSFAQMLYEHRLNSKDVKGFFATSNSAGCLFNLAIFSGIAVFASGIKKQRKKLKAIVLPTVIMLVLLSGLYFTASKGAIVSFVAALFILCFVYLFGNFLNRRRVAVICLSIAAFIIFLLLVIGYGLKHNTLPGGNSMLVRWEYWTAASEIIADNFIKGIGGNNFGTYYTHYKVAKSLETVRDPHCFLLTIFSGYGIIGLTGFLTCMFIPILSAMKKSAPLKEHDNNSRKLMQYTAIPAIVILLLLRPLAIRSEIGNQIEVVIYIIAVMYVAPVFMFGVVLWLCYRSKECWENISISKAALLCGIFAVFFHNLIDFGIFEPGIFTALLAIMALTVLKQEDAHIIHLKKSYRHAAATCTIAIAAVCVWLFILPVGKTAFKVELAKDLSGYGYLDKAIEILNSAQNDDKFNPAPAVLNGMIQTYYYQSNPLENKDNLALAEKSFKTAISRDPADFKNYEKLSDTYQSLAEANPAEVYIWFAKALDAINQAINRYPSGGELYLKAAILAQRLNKNDEAIEDYTQVIAIENAYREEFKIMYPGMELFSRIGEINYKFAKDKLIELKAKDENK